MVFIQMGTPETMRAFVKLALRGLYGEVKQLDVDYGLKNFREVSFTYDNGEVQNIIAWIHDTCDFREAVLPTKEFLGELRSLEYGDFLNYWNMGGFVTMNIMKDAIGIDFADLPRHDRHSLTPPDRFFQQEQFNMQQEQFSAPLDQVVRGIINPKEELNPEEEIQF